MQKREASATATALLGRASSGAPSARAAAESDTPTVKKPSTTSRSMTMLRGGHQWVRRQRRRHQGACDHGDQRRVAGEEHHDASQPHPGALRAGRAAWGERGAHGEPHREGHRTRDHLVVGDAVRQRVRAEQGRDGRVAEVPGVDRHRADDDPAERRARDPEPPAHQPRHHCGKQQTDHRDHQSDRTADREVQVCEADVTDERHEHVQHRVQHPAGRALGPRRVAVRDHADAPETITASATSSTCG